MDEAVCRRVLVTGAAGFVGRHMLAALAKRSWALLGIGRGSPLALPSKVEFRLVDLSEKAELSAQIAAFRPSHILHLAAHSSVSEANQSAARTWRANVVSVVNVAEAVLAEAPRATLIFASSSEVYGRSFLKGEPLSEDAALEPMGIYARTKRAGEEILQDVLAGSEVRLIVLRPFNHIGPGQSEKFVVASFAGQIAKIEVGLAPPRVEVGNLSARREFLDVRDVVRAYESVIAASESFPSGVVLNICSGHPRTIASVLDDLRGLARKPFEVTVAADRLRSADIPVATGNAARIRAATGWLPQVPWADTLLDTLNAARQQYQQGR